jgi:hypothetical protein
MDLAPKFTQLTEEERGKLIAATKDLEPLFKA